MKRQIESKKRQKKRHGSAEAKARAKAKAKAEAEARAEASSAIARRTRSKTRPISHNLEPINPSDVFSGKRPAATPPHHDEVYDHKINNAYIEPAVTTEKVGEVELGNQKMHSLSKIGLSTGQERNEIHSTVNSKQKSSPLRKEISSFDLPGSFSTDDECFDFFEGWNNNAGIEPALTTEKMGKAEFGNPKMNFVSKIGPSEGQQQNGFRSTVNSWKKLDGLRNEKLSVDHHGSPSSDDDSFDFFKGWPDKSGNESRDLDTFDQIDEAELGKETCSMSKIRDSKRQKVDSLNRNVSNVNLSESFPSEDVGLGSGQGQPGNGEESTDSETSVKVLDELEFRNKNTPVLSKIKSSPRKQLDEGCFVSTSEEKCAGLSKPVSSTENISKNRKKQASSAFSRWRKDQPWCEALNADFNVSSVEWTSSNSSRKVSFQENDKDNSFGARHDTKTGVKAREVDNFSMGSLDDSDSSSTDSAIDSSDDEEFVVEKSSDKIEPFCSYVEAHEVKDKRSTGVSANNSEECRKQKGKAVVHAPMRSCSSNLQNEEKNCNQPASSRRKISFAKGLLGTDASSKQSKQGKACKISGSPAENEETSRCFDDNIDTQMMQEKEASPSHPKHDGNPTDDDIQRTFDLVDGEKKQVPVIDEVEKLAKKKQVAPKHYDFCTMLANSVLQREPTVEMKDNDEQSRQPLDTQTEDTLPLKFTFEDEVPQKVEKTESEKEMDELWDEFESMWIFAGLGSYDHPKTDQNNAKSTAEETQDDRCARGEHDLILKEEEGLICVCCDTVVLGPKDVMPPMVERTYRGSGRKRYSEPEQLPEFDEHHLQSSIDNFAGSSNIANGTVWNIKPGIRESMYEHQQEGFEFLWKNLAGSIKLEELKSSDPGEVGGCIISHAPGTGKTRLTIVFIETYLRIFPNCRPLIIAPATMLLTWEEEFRKWNVGFPFYNLNNLELSGKENKTALELFAGTKGRKRDANRWIKLYSWNTGKSILGISYCLFERMTGKKCSDKETRSQLREIILEKPGLVVLDEGHTPRNKNSNIWKAIVKLQTEKRIILSGTPFQNNFNELFSTLRIARPAVADSLERQRRLAEQSDPHSEAMDRAVEKLKTFMSPFVHVHKGTVLRQSLPGLKDTVILVKPPRLQKSLIERLEGSPCTLPFEHKVALISVHPYLLRYCDSTEELRIGIDLGAVKASRRNPNEGAKTKFILELVRYSVALKEKVVVFSQYIQPLELIKEQLIEILKWVFGKQILELNGEIEQKQRQNLINRFNDPRSDSKVMLASTKCCSEGISLVGASRVVLLDVVWNPSVERQAISRAYRIGQKKLVYTYHLMTAGTTEAEKYCRQAEKERLSELVFTSSSNESNKQNYPSGTTEDRILEEMIGHPKLNEMFEKIINQPKDADLVQTFGLTH